MLILPKNIFVGTEQDDCFHGFVKNWAVVHACKYPCHKLALGYEHHLQKTHPNYLTYLNGKHLYLNIIDTHSPKFFSLDLFESSIRFISTFAKQGHSVLIHCNKGESRSPSIALVYLARETDLITDSDYDNAREDFYPLFPTYLPRSGIDAFLRENWKALMNI